MHVAKRFRSHLKDFTGEPVVVISRLQPVDHVDADSSDRFEFCSVSKQRLDENVSSSFCVPKTVNVLPQFFDALPSHSHEVFERDCGLPAMLCGCSTVLCLCCQLHQAA